MKSGREQRETGAIAIEAVLGITFFLVSMLSIMFISQLVRLEAKMQYAADQTAKEVASYFYLLDKVGVAKFLGDTVKEEEKKDLNETIEAFSGFAGDVGDTFSMDLNFDSPEGAIDTGKNVVKQGKELYASATNLYDKIKALGENPGENIGVVLKMFVESLTNRLIAPFICEMLFPKYIASGDGMAEKYLKQNGVEDGMDGVCFYHSTFLADDGRSISVVVDYKVNTKALTFGLINTDMYFRKVAVTSAWIKPNPNDKEYPLKSLVEAYKKRESLSGDTKGNGDDTE